MSKSVQEFREWATAQKTVGNPQVNTYRGQCVSLVQQYLWHVFGIPYAARGNAKDYVPPHFSRLPANTARRPGDIIRYGANYGGGYGHVGLIDDDGKFFDQNGVKRLAIGRRDMPFAGIESVWRPNKPFHAKKPKPVQPAKPKMPPINTRIQLLPKQVRTTFKAGTTTVRGHINVVNDQFIYFVRGYDPKYPYRIIINTASGGGNGVALALYYTNGKLIEGWKRI